MSETTVRAMGQFRYEAQDTAGHALRGTLEAAGAADAEARLTALGLRAIAVDAAPVAEGSVRPRSLGAEDFLLFNRQLAHLTKAGLPVERGLRLIAGDMKSGRLAAAARAVAGELEKGKSLPEAFDMHARRFPALYGRLMEAGIKTGDLPAMLFSLGRHLELAARLRQMLWNTLAYPIAVLAGLAVVIGIIAMYILPMLHNIYGDFHVQLPMITQVFLWLGEQMRALGIGAAVVAALLLVLAIVVRVKGTRLRAVDVVARRIPGVGPVVSRGQLARWCDALKVAVEAGLDLPAALELASEAVGSAGILHDGRALAERVRRGESLDGAAQGEVVPAAVPAAIGIASRSGDLPAALGTLSAMYAEQAEQRVRALPAVLTPILFLIIAVCFGMTLLAIFLPLLRLIQAVSGGAKVTEPLNYRVESRHTLQTTGEEATAMRIGGPPLWGFVGLLVLLAGFCAFSGYLRDAPAVPVTIGWSWAVIAFVAVLMLVRTLRAIRRAARGLLVLGWLDAAVRLNLPLTKFLIAAGAGERGMLGRRLRELGQTLATGVPVGVALAHAVPEVPPRLARQLSAAETLGQLAPALREIVEREGFGKLNRAKGAGAMRGIYPMVVLLAGTYLVLGLIIFVIPKFREIFQDFRIPLPPLTEHLLWFADLLVNDQPLILLALTLVLFVVLLAIVGRALREIFTPWWPHTTAAWLRDTVLWYLPVAHRLARDRALADVCEFLGNATRAGVPLPEALAQTMQLDMNMMMREKITSWRATAASGLDPAAAARASGLPKVLAGFMDAAAQQQGGLAEAFDFLSRYYRTRHTRLAAAVGDATEPLITLCLALVVGTVVFALFQPLVALINATMEPQWSGVL